MLLVGVRSSHHLMTHHLVSVCCRHTNICQYDTVASAPIPNMHTTCVPNAKYVLASCTISRPILWTECLHRECNNNNKQIGTSCVFHHGSQHPITANWSHTQKYTNNKHMLALGVFILWVVVNRSDVTICSSMWVRERERDRKSVWYVHELDRCI